MYSKKLSFTTTQLNTHNVQSGVIPITMAPSGIVGGPKPYLMYPRAMQILNTTGQTINFGLLDSDAQFVEYQASTTNFQLVPINNNGSWTVNTLYPLPRSKHLLVQCPSGTVTTGLDVHFMSYN